MLCISSGADKSTSEVLIIATWLHPVQFWWIVVEGGNKAENSSIAMALQVKSLVAPLLFCKLNQQPSLLQIQTII